MTRLLIMACSRSKRTAVGPLPARDRYDGPLWKTLRAVDPGQRLAPVAFLSARYGFGSADMPIELYDALMNSGLAKEMIAGGMTAHWPRPASNGGIGAHASTAGQAIAEICGQTPREDVCLVGGQLYIEVMQAYVSEFRRLGHIATNAKIVVINDQIGFMRQQLRRWLIETA